MIEPGPARGSLHRITVTSAAIAGNLVGAHLDRAVDVYVPVGGSGGVPLLVDLVGFTGSGLSHTAWRGFGDNLPTRLDRLIATGAMPPVVVAFPDCFTRLGGNQYINSSAMCAFTGFAASAFARAVLHASSAQSG